MATLSFLAFIYLLGIATILLNPSYSFAFQATRICRYKHNISPKLYSPTRLSLIQNAENTEIDETIAQVPEAFLANRKKKVTSVSLRNHSTQKSSYRMRVFATLKNPKIELLSSAAVILSTFLVAVSTLDNLSVETYEYIEYAVSGLNILFTVDFFLRWYSAGQFKLIYLTKPLAIVDLFVVIIPLFLGSVMPMLDSIGLMGDIQQAFATNVAASSGLQVLLLLRILRLKRVLTDIQTFRRFAVAVGIRGSEVRPYQLQLARVLLSIFTLLSVASGLIYTAEHSVNPAIPDYFTALYFGLTTLTTVGFGDITPITFNGRLVVCGSILAGVAVIPAQAAQLVDAIIASQQEDKAGGSLSGRTSSTSLSSTRRISSSRVMSSATDGLGPSGADLEVPPKDVGNAIDSYKVCGNCQATGHRIDATFCFNCGSKI